MPRVLIATLRSTLRDIERYETENSTIPELQQARLAIQEMIDTLEHRIVAQKSPDSQDSE
jgi:hypothetical protein